ncbi:MAG: tetratricopeptide repeat protein, partial [Candidatus Eisenbacteria bacterium]|nr:tetratricopeptide repeat protein [Candidatus Eisenbacteria bacterium]
MSTPRTLVAMVALALAAVTASIPVSAATGLQRGFEAALAAEHWDAAARLADSLVRAREVRGGLSGVAAATLFDSLGRRIFMAGTPDAMTAAERLFRAGLARRERALGPDDLAVANSLATLATLLDYLGRWAEAVPLAKRALAIREQQLGERRAETASILRQLGLLQFQLGAYESAARPLERSAAIYDTLGAGFEARAADARNNLGELARVRDRLDEAEAQFQRGLAIARARLPAGDPIRLALANNLAGLFKDVARFDEAEPLLEDVLAILEAAGDDREALATARLNLAEVLRLQGRASAAAPFYARGLDEARATLGAEHPGLVPFLNQSAVCEQALGAFARAESLYLESGRIVVATLGREHPLVAQNLSDLAGLRRAAGRVPEADSLLRIALALRERALGRAHPDVALVLVELARTRAEADRDFEVPLGRAIAILDSTRAYPDARLDAYALRAEWNARHGRRTAAIADMGRVLTAMDSLRLQRGGGDETRTAFLAARARARGSR